MTDLSIITLMIGISFTIAGFTVKDTGFISSAQPWLALAMLLEYLK